MISCIWPYAMEVVYITRPTAHLVEDSVTITCALAMTFSLWTEYPPFTVQHACGARRYAVPTRHCRSGPQKLLNAYKQPTSANHFIAVYDLLTTDHTRKLQPQAYLSWDTLTSPRFGSQQLPIMVFCPVLPHN